MFACKNNIFVTFIFLILATTAPPTTTGAATTEYPPEKLLYVATSDYHWPNFNKNMTKWIPDTFDFNTDGLSDGPFGFGKSVKLDKEQVNNFYDIQVHLKCIQVCIGHKCSF